MKATKSFMVLAAMVIQLPCLGGENIAALSARAERGDAQAQLELGQELFKGKQSARDSRSGLRWICESAWQGNPEAQRNYAEKLAGWNGVLHAWFFRNNGEYDLKDSCKNCLKPERTHLVDSYYWLKVASRQGKDNRGMEKQLKRELSMEEIVSGEKAANEWRPRQLQPWTPNPACQVWLTAKTLEETIVELDRTIEMLRKLPADMERIRTSAHAAMPEPKCSPGSKPLPLLVIDNRTKHTIRIFKQGPIDSLNGVHDVAPSSSREIFAVPGRNYLAVEIPGLAVMPFYGEHTFEKGTQCQLVFQMPENIK